MSCHPGGHYYWEGGQPNLYLLFHVDLLIPHFRPSDHIVFPKEDELCTASGKQLGEPNVFLWTKHGKIMRESENQQTLKWQQFDIYIFLIIYQYLQYLV